MGRDEPAGGSNLPAPYRNPWRSLAEALAAVAADSRLRLRELWRRNGEGDLPSPGWWPRDLAPLFWPLLLAAALSAALALLLMAVSLVRTAPAELPAVSPEALPEFADPSEPSGLSGAPAPEPVPASEPVPVPAPAAAAADESAADTAAETAAETDASGAVEPEPAAPDPLAELLERPGAAGLLRAAYGQPQRGTLLLQVRPAFNRQPRAEQQRLAELWQSWATELGYDHLELRDGLGALLARDALVGNGMIVLSSKPA
jgi:hypothetical protein